MALRWQAIRVRLGEWARIVLVGVLLANLALSSYDGYLLWKQNRILREQNQMLYEGLMKVGNLYLQERERKSGTNPVQ